MLQQSYSRCLPKSDENMSQQKTCTQAFTAASVTVIGNRKQPQYLSAEVWLGRPHREMSPRGRQGQLLMNAAQATLREVTLVERGQAQKPQTA